MKQKIINFLWLEAAFLILSLSSVFAKAASAFALSDIRLTVNFTVSIALLAVYALLWQQILKRFSLTVAFSNRVVTYFWLLLWSVLFFKETITIFNILGLFLISIGIIVVSRDD